MLRSVSSAGALLFGLLVFSASALSADAEAEKIRRSIGAYLSDLNGPDFSFTYDLQVVPLGPEYEVSVRDLSVRDQNAGDSVTIGDVVFRAQPLEDGNYRFSQVRVPEEIRVDNPDDPDAFLVFRPGLEHYEGVFSPKFETELDYDLLVRDFSFEFAHVPEETGLVEHNVFTIKELSGSQRSQAQADGGMEQSASFNFSDLRIGAGEEALFRISGGGSSFDWQLGDFAGFMADYSEVLDQLVNLDEDDEQGLLRLVRFFLQTPYKTSYLVGDLAFDTITFDSPKTGLTIERLVFESDSRDMDSDSATQNQLISMRGFALKAPQDPVKDATFKLLPRRWTIPMRVERVPSRAIGEEYDRLFAQTTSFGELLAERSNLHGFNPRITKLLQEAGTQVRLDGQSMESEIVSATLDGTLAFDAGTPFQITGTVSAQVLGLMQLFQHAQTIQDPKTAQQIMQAAMIMLSTGETEPGTQVPSVTSYEVEFTPAGTVLLNGNQVNPPPAAPH